MWLKVISVRHNSLITWPFDALGSRVYMVLWQPKKPTWGAFGQFTAEKRGDFRKQCEGKSITEVIIVIWQL